MARLDDLIAQVQDDDLRRQLKDALADVKRHQQFGLVYEPHEEEAAILPGLPVTPGALVQRRDDESGKVRYRVLAVESGNASLEAVRGGGAGLMPVESLMVVKPFGEPIYPALTPLGSVCRGPAERPYHAVINAENYHALQLLRYLYEGQVDCIYIDPPYNTGARDWKYNNRYVDANDKYRHSKWLSFMEKRLRLAQQLLRPSGVMIVTIDDYEVHHLGVLVETRLERLRPLGTAVIRTTPSGRPTVRGFRTNHEYAFFLGAEHAEVHALDKSEEQLALFNQEDDRGKFAWVNLRKRGGGNTLRDARPKQYYPFYLCGDSLRIPRMDWDGESRRWNILESPLPGEEQVYPVGDDGRERIWALGHTTAEASMSDLKVRRDKAGRPSILRALRLIDERSQPSTWWDDNRYSIVEWGTGLLARTFGASPFPFPKSVYAVSDCLRVAGADDPDALIVDFFGGSGTALHATCLLNAGDHGRRRCVLVTNNEVTARTARDLNSQGCYAGDEPYERHGLFWSVTRPRCEAAVTGQRPDGSAIPGNYESGHALAEGFRENLEFLSLDYLAPESVELRQQFEAILPALWLAAGGIGPREIPQPGQTYSMPAGGRYAVLFEEGCFRQFEEALAARPDVTHVWLVTDSEEAYSEMSAALPGRLKVSMLYRDYLRNFRINTEANL